MRREMITSRQNETVKLLASLSRKKAREELSLFRFDGKKLLSEALSKGVVPEYIFVSESRLGEVEGIISSAADICEVTVLSDVLFEKISEEKSPEGVITVAKALDKIHKIATINNKGEFSCLPETHERVMLLESVRDPGNIGTIIRTAASLGVDRLIISSDCADIYNPRTIRAAMGALFTEKIDTVESELFADYISALRAEGRRVYAAALHREALTLGEFAVKASDCFVIGNEGHGLSEDVIASCDGCALIPISEGCESLNAAMAAGIFMWEISRSHE